MNYSGSTGYGRTYRERLRHQWGVADVEDVIAAAQALAESGEADAARLAIRGFSAGGWTALSAVTGSDAGANEMRQAGNRSKAAVSYSGIADPRDFAATTHDFESRYLDGLIGPLPGFEARYAERSPLGHVTGDTVPVLLLQGEDDQIVPPAQARGMARELKAHGVRHAVLEFEGESHELPPRRIHNRPPWKPNSPSTPQAMGFAHPQHPPDLDQLSGPATPATPARPHTPASPRAQRASPPPSASRRPYRTTVPGLGRRGPNTSPALAAPSALFPPDGPSMPTQSRHPLAGRPEITNVGSPPPQSRDPSRCRPHLRSLGFRQGNKPNQKETRMPADLHPNVSLAMMAFRRGKHHPAVSLRR